MVEILQVDFNDKKHCQAVIDLMNHYMTDKMGDHPPHSPEKAARMIDGLKKHPNKICLLALSNGEFAGLVNSFISYGTFAAKPFINIHDVVVLDTHRGNGIGRKLLAKIAEMAEEMDCGKITLEVRTDNANAQHLYNSMGYVAGDVPMLFWSKYL